MRGTISVEGQQRCKFWENHLRDWQESGLSQTGYCRKHGLSHKSFLYWKKRLEPSRVAVSLVEVPKYQSAGILSPCQPIRLLLGNRYGIEIERGFDEQTLDRLLRVLEER